MGHDNVMEWWAYTRLDTNLINCAMEELVIEYQN